MKTITPILDKAIEAKELANSKSRKPRAHNRFWPSSSSVAYVDKFGEIKVEGKCLRSEYWSILGEPITNPTNARSLRIMAAGKRMEDFEIESATEAGILVDTQRKFEHKLPSGAIISGSLDGVMKLDGKEVAVEYKSGYGVWFRKDQLGLGTDGKRLVRFTPSPKMVHVLQVLLYLDHYRGQIDDFRLIYLDRGDGENFEYSISLDEEGHGVIGRASSEATDLTPFTIHDIYARFEELAGYLTRGEVPPPDYLVIYTEALVDKLKSRDWWDGGMTNKALASHQRWRSGEPGGRRAGHYLCNGYCPFESKCKALVNKEIEETGTFFCTAGRKANEDM